MAVRLRGRNAKTTTPEQKKFIIEYVKNGGQKMKAAEKIGIPMRTVSRWFSESEIFNQEVHWAEETFYESLRSTMITRANSGKSDALLMFALKSRYPEIYDENIRALVWKQKQLESGNGAPLQITFVRDDEPEMQVIDNVKTIDFTPKANGTNGHIEIEDSEPED